MAKGLQTEVHGSNLDDNGQISAGSYGNGDFGDIYTQQRGVFGLYAKTVNILHITGGQMDAQGNGLALHNGAHAVQHRYVDQTDTTDLHQVTDDIGCTADQYIVRDFADLDNVIGDHTMSALEQFQRSFTFADAGLAGKKHAYAVNVDQSAVPRNGGCQFVIQNLFGIFFFF